MYGLVFIPFLCHEGVYFYIVVVVMMSRPDDACPTVKEYCGVILPVKHKIGQNHFRTQTLVNSNTGMSKKVNEKTV